MKKKKMLISIVGLILLSVILVGIIHQQNVKAERIKHETKKEVKETVQKNQEDPYKNLSKANAETVANLDKYVAKVIDEKLNKKPLDSLKNTEEALKVLDVDDADLKSIHEAYGEVINVVKTPEIEVLQMARTSIANMEDTNLSEYMINAYEDKLIEIVAQNKFMDKDEVDKLSKPLTPQQVKSKNEAKEAADKKTADQVKQEAKKAERVAAAEQQSQSSAVADNGYTAPVNNEYTAPTDNDYSAPADNGYIPPANDGAAQEAENNTETPAVPIIEDNISGNQAPNGHEMEPGGW